MEHIIDDQEKKVPVEEEHSLETQQFLKRFNLTPEALSLKAED